MLHDIGLGNNFWGHDTKITCDNKKNRQDRLHQAKNIMQRKVNNQH